MSTKIKIQLILGLTVLIFVSFVVYANRELLMHGFTLNFFGWKNQQPIPNVVFLLVFFLVGAVGVFVMNLGATFRFKRQINALQDELATFKCPATAAEIKAPEAPAEQAPSA